MDKARAVELFATVARAGGFSAAAMDVGMSVQALSKAVKQLEAHLGVRLFHRTTRTLKLTDEGARLLEVAGPALKMLEEVLDEDRTSSDGREGIVRITAPVSLGARMLVPLVRSYRLEHPKILFDLVLDDLDTDLVQSKIDIGFRIGGQPSRNVVSRRLSALPLAIVATPEYLKRHGEPKTLAELLTHPCTGFRLPSTGRLLPWELNIDGELTYQDVPSVCNFNSVLPELDAVKAGIGIGQLSLYLIREELASGELVEILPQFATAASSVYMYYPQRTQMPKRVRDFISYVIKAAPALLPAPR
ncbi:MAG TPA: LysR family transcriptional regulator [Pseudoduganella sp.]